MATPRAALGRPGSPHWSLCVTVQPDTPHPTVSPQATVLLCTPSNSAGTSLGPPLSVRGQPRASCLGLALHMAFTVLQAVGFLRCPASAPGCPLSLALGHMKIWTSHDSSHAPCLLSMRACMAFPPGRFCCQSCFLPKLWLCF